MANVITIQTLLSAEPNANGARLHHAGKLYTYRDGSKAVFINNEKTILSERDYQDYLDQALYLTKQFVGKQIKESGSVIATYFDDYKAYEFDFASNSAVVTFYVSGLSAYFKLNERDEFSFFAMPNQAAVTILERKPARTMSSGLTEEFTHAMNENKILVIHYADGSRESGDFRDDQNRYVFSYSEDGTVAEVLKKENVLPYLQKKYSRGCTLSINF